MNTQVEGNVLQLISLLAKATKEKFHTSISDFIDGMLLMTLTKALTDCLAVLHANVPAVKDRIQGQWVYTYILRNNGIIEIYCFLHC